MRICVDIQSAIAQVAGVGRYTRELVTHLPHMTNDEISLFYFDFKRHGCPFTVEHARHHAVHWIPGRWVQTAWKTLSWPPFDAFAGPADVYHFPNFIRPPLRRGASVVSIHDASFLRFPEFTEEKNARYLSARFASTCRDSDAIITISEFSAGEIAELAGVDRKKIHAIPLGISPHFHRPDDDTIRDTLRKLGLDAPYLLMVSTIEPRKNIQFLVDAFEQMTRFNGKLVLAGRRGWKYEATLDRIRSSSRAKDIVWIEQINDNMLPSLYAGASLFLFPSWYEGFGFPPLEAMACGTPVLSSAGGSLPEVLGEAATILHQYDPGVWANTALQMLEDTALRNTLSARGLQRAASYTWEETARQTVEVYRTVAK